MSIKDYLYEWLTWEDGWDGYRAPKFLQSTVDHALLIIQQLEQYFGPPTGALNDVDFDNPDASPCSDGTICLEYHSKRGATWELFIYVQSDGTLEHSFKECHINSFSSIGDIEETIKQHSVKLPDPYCYMKD